VSGLASGRVAAEINGVSRIDAFRARDPRAATRSCTLILTVTAAVLLAFNVAGLGTGTATAQISSWVLVVVLLAVAVACARVRPETLDRTGLLSAVGVGGVALLCAIDVLTADPSAAAQAFFAFPVLWASAHLREAAVVVVTTAAVAGEATTLLVLLPPREAVTDTVFFGAVLVVVAVMQTRANRTQDRLVAALHGLARVDALTGLVNRRSFDEAVESVVRSSPPAGTTMMLIDIDRFKMINDAYGHPAGDAALVHVAEVLREHVRADDAVLARLGGDELAVLLPGCSPRAGTSRAQELLHAVAARPLHLDDGTSVPLSVSIGVAHSSQVPTVASLYTAADDALYRAKRAGRGRVTDTSH